jgi:uncharacterized BrkB/YihY/UPF0761 family membrane protein
VPHPERWELAIIGIVLLLQAIAAAAGFLIAVLWFDLMFDAQVLRYRRERGVPETVLDSISAYYHRVTTTASPMGRLVGMVMLALLIALIVRAARGDAPTSVNIVSIAAALVSVGLAGLRVFRRARRLGWRTDSPDVRSEMARGILRDHLICLASMVTLLAAQLIGA